MVYRWGVLPAATLVVVGWHVGRSEAPSPLAAQPDPVPETAAPAPAPVPRAAVLPGEFEPVDRVLVSWDPGLRAVYANIAAAVEHQAEMVFLVRPGEESDIADLIDEYGLDANRSRTLAIDTDTIWVRDYAPFRMRGPQGRWVVEFEYEERPVDDVAATLVAEALWPGEGVRSAPFRLDGGNLLSNGAGICVATEQIFEVDDRYSRIEVRRIVREYLGCRRLVIVPRLADEPTGHVDMYIALTAPDRALVGRFENHPDPFNAEQADLAAERLVRAGFQVDRVRMPPNHDGRMRSHTNALAVNDVVLVPTYDEDPIVEAEVVQTFARAYPARTIVPIDATDLIALDGAVHCIAVTTAR